jgi:hypothetical protein
MRLVKIGAGNVIILVLFLMKLRWPMNREDCVIYKTGKSLAKPTYYVREYSIYKAPAWGSNICRHMYWSRLPSA